MTLLQDPPQHPVLRFAGALDSALDRAHQSEPAFMTAGERREALLALRQAETRLQALQLRILAAAAGDDITEAGAFRDTADFLAAEPSHDIGSVRRDQRLATALDARWQHLAAGVRAGRVNTAQASVIVEGLDRLPDDLDPATITAAEQMLVDLAGKHPPKELRRLAKRILEYVAPDIADEEEAKALDAEERRAREGLSLHVRRNADGVPGRSMAIWKAAAHDIDRLLTYLDAYTSPRHQDSPGETDRSQDSVVPGSPASGERLPIFKQRGLAMLSLLEHLDPAKLPQHGGTATSLIVTIDHDVLMGRLGTASLLPGDQITAGEARRLACNAGIIPAVLGGDSKVLDLGRTERLFSKAQVTALRLRDKRCRAEGCQQLAERCEAHHKDPWAQGGNTDLDDGILVCSFHHHRIHDDRFQHEYLPNGDVRFSRRT